MFFNLSKILPLLIDPVFVLAGLAFALLAKTRLCVWPRVLCGLGFAVLVLLATPAIATRGYRALETCTPASPLRSEYDAVVVLAGMVSLDLSDERHLEFNGAVDRILAGIDEIRSGRARVLILSGGTGELMGSRHLEADLLKSFATRQGVEAERILVDSSSRNTWENAVETRRIVARHAMGRILLVTSAAHLPRALGCFRAVGIHPDVLPVDFVAVPAPWDDFRSYLPNSNALGLSGRLVREGVGLVVYWSKGYALPPWRRMT